MAKKDKTPFASKFKENVRKWLGVNQQVAATTEEAARGLSNTKSIPRLQENVVWYLGNAERLLDFYKMYIGSNTGRENYFYAKSAYEGNKKTHSGVPRAIVDTICNVTGIPSFDLTKDETAEVNEEAYLAIKERLDEVVDFNDLENIIKQTARPYTLVVGGGAFIVSDLSQVDPTLDKPLIEFVDERECDILTIGNIFIGIERRVNYTHDDTGKKYVLHEKRTYNKIENYLTDEQGNLVSLQTLPETAHLKPVKALAIDMIPAVPLRFKNGYRTYGLSIYEGRLDLFDDLDQTLSQLSELARTSTPITYMDTTMLAVKNGKPVLPSTFKRQFQVIEKNPNQTANRELKTEQPSLNYQGLLDLYTSQLIQTLTGLISPSSLGIEIQRNSNAEAMREKEKVTLVTRDDIIDNEKGAIRRLLELAMRVYDVMQGKGAAMEYDIAVDYPDFSSPTFEQVSATLLPLWMADAISPKQFAKLLHTDTLTDEDLEKEIAYLESKKAAPKLFDEMFSDGEDGQSTIPQENEDKPENPME